MKKLFAIIFVYLLLTGSAFAGNTYNQYGSKTGSYRTNSSTTTTYDRYGSRTGTYKTNGNTTTKYNQYGSKQGTIKKTSSGYTTYDKYGSKTGATKQTPTAQPHLMTNTVEKLAHSKPIPQVKQPNTTATVEKSEVLSNLS